MVAQILDVHSRDVADRGCVLSAVGEIDHDSCALLLAVVDEAIARGRVQLVVDLAEVTFCDSGGLSALVDAHRRADARGGGLRLAAAQPRVLAVLQATNLDRYLSLYASVDEATGDLGA
jgi:anti-sigma B factor antagonist